MNFAPIVNNYATIKQSKFLCSFYVYSILFQIQILIDQILEYLILFKMC